MWKRLLAALIGGTQLTDLGREIVNQYRHAEAAAQWAGKRDLDALVTLLR